MTKDVNELVRAGGIEQYCGHRNRALELYEQAARTLQEAQQAQRLAMLGGSTYTDGPSLRSLDGDVSEADIQRFTTEARTQIDQRMWRRFIKGTPLGGLMDAEERKRFESSLEKDPPEVTPDTVYATMHHLASQADTIFRRGLVNVFAGLCRDYRSHDGFKIENRIVLTHAFNEQTPAGRQWGWGQSCRREEAFHDIDRVFHVLDGKPPPENRGSGIVNLIEEARQSKAEKDVQNDYIRVKWFGNGNAHVWFLRSDLVEQANRIIADHYGAAVGAGPDAASKAA